MCAIIDASIVGDLIAQNATPAVTGFRQAVDSGRIPLVLGGTQLSSELKADDVRRWISALTNAGRLRKVDASAVDELTEHLRRIPKGAHNACKSDDWHVIALAQISGARLLYTNDHKLTEDFKNKQLIDNPRGKVYSTTENSDFTKARKQLLNNRDLCRTRAATLSPRVGG